MKFVALYLRGETDEKKVRKDLEKAVLDETFLTAFLDKANFESFKIQETS